MKTTYAIGLSSLVLVIGCATAPVPTRQLVTAESSIQRAEQSGADSATQAAMHLKMAQDQLEDARALIAKGLNERARYTLLRANADADLAAALAQQESTRTEAQRVMAQADALKPR